MMIPSPEKRSLRVLLAPFGSEGDVAPFLWIADLLAERGHQVRIAANPYFEDRVRSRGHSFLPVGSIEEVHSVVHNPRIWSRWTGPHLLMNYILDSLPSCDEAMRKDGTQADLLLCTSLAVGAVIAAELRRIPQVRIHLQPAPLRSVGDLPILMDELSWMRCLPAWALKGYFRLIDLFLDGAPMRRINRFRASLGLAPWRSFYRDALHGSAALAGLFPEWFAPRQPDWPAGLQLFDFPTEPAKPGSLSEPLRQFLAAGEAPVLWTHGSANYQTVDFVRAAEACCERLKLRGIIVAPQIESSGMVPKADMLRLNYAPFSDLFPHCRAIVHHGGIGTLSKALHAGLPQLIIPRAYDQFDNAGRVERLGLGLQLSYHQLCGLTARLQALLSSQEYSKRARELSEKPACSSSLADWLENIAAQRSRNQGLTL